MQVFRRKVECKGKGSGYLALITICRNEKGMHGGIDWGKQRRLPVEQIVKKIK